MLIKTFQFNYHDRMGIRVMQQIILPKDGSLELNVSSLVSGQYFLVLMAENGEFYYGKLLIK